MRSLIDGGASNWHFALAFTARAGIVRAARRCLWIGVVAVSLAACGSQSITVVTVTRPTGPVWCPTIFHAQTSGMSSPNRRVTGSFDTRVLLGHAEAYGTVAARRHGCSLRVVNRGGPLTTDGRQKRIDIDINHGIITATSVG